MTWVPVRGAEDSHLVSNDGQVKSVDRYIVKSNRWGSTTTCLHRGQILKPIPRGQRGYPSVTINGRIRYVHTVMLESFVGPRPEGMQGLHWDDDPAHNVLSNLRWDTPGANQSDCVRNGNHPEAKRSRCDAGHEYVPGSFRMAGNTRICLECRRDIEARRKPRHRDDLRASVGYK